MFTGSDLAALSEIFISNYLTDIEWGNSWREPISSGKAFEWTFLAAIIYEAKARGYNCSCPILSISNGSMMFPLWNEIPRQHVAQPGHAGAIAHKVGLEARFIQALIPKFVLEKDGRYYSIFREGCPYHKIFFGDYIDRPDILILPGHPTLGFPRYLERRNEVEFSFDIVDSLRLTGVLRVVNSAIIPCRIREPQDPFKIPVTGIIECSVNKSLEVATEQLNRYYQLFSSPLFVSQLVLVTGNNQTGIPYPSISIPLEGIDGGNLEARFLHAAQFALDCFRI